MKLFVLEHLVKWFCTSPILLSGKLTQANSGLFDIFKTLSLTQANFSVFCETQTN